MNGLAATMAGAPAGPAMGGQTSPMRDIGQIVQLLKQGISPEELVQNGVPVELVQAAMEVIAQEQTQIPSEQEGLAGMYMNPESVVGE